MSRLALTLLFLLTASSLVLAQAIGPRIRFDTTTIDIGEIEQGGLAEAHYLFTNIGDRDLVLTSVKSSCGCYVAKWSSEPVKPGQQGEITGRYDSNRIGMFSKTLSVVSNDSVTGTVMLFIKGHILPRPPQEPTFRIDKPYFRDDNVYRSPDILQGSKAPLKVPFRNDGLAPLLISNVTTSAGISISEWPRSPFVFQATDSLEFSIDTGTLGEFSKSVIVHTNHPTEAMTYLRIEGKVVAAKDEDK